MLYMQYVIAAPFASAAENVVCDGLDRVPAALPEHLGRPLLAGTPCRDRGEKQIFAGLAQPQGALTPPDLTGDFLDPPGFHHHFEVPRQGGSVKVIGAANLSARRQAHPHDRAEQSMLR